MVDLRNSRSPMSMVLSQSFANQYGVVVVHVVQCSAEWISDVAVSTRLENAKGGEGRLKREEEGNKTEIEKTEDWIGDRSDFEVTSDFRVPLLI